MSRHHMLPPLVYTPPPAPKKVEPKKRRLQVGSFDEMDEAAETSETAATSPAAPVAIKPPLAPMLAIEDSASKPQRRTGRLSQDTMTVLLRAQELN